MADTEQVSDAIVAEAEAAAETLAQVKAEIAKAVFGQDRVVELSLAAVLAGGHALLIGAPGLAKTRLVEAMGTALGLANQRIQFTPDLMPSDIIGSEVLDESPSGQRTFRFLKGPIFTQLLMADEINRASPRTQSALLQAMQERHVTVAGVRHDLPAPFHVLATQNPIEQEGTYPLPEAQLDRFFYKLVIPSPDDGLLADIVTHTTGVQREKSETAQHVDGLSFEELQGLQALPPLVETPQSALNFTVQLCQVLNPVTGRPSALAAANEYVMYGPSPRGAQALILAAKVRALVEGLPNINADLIAKVAGPALRHRVILNHRAAIDGMDSDSLITAAIQHLRDADQG